MRYPPTYNMPRGRPRKYSNEEKRKEARRETVRASKLRKKQPATYPNFVPYAPEPPDVPFVTPSGVGLRISPDISVPYDPLDIDDIRDDEQPLALLRDGVEAADATSQHQPSDREHTHEENEHEDREEFEQR